MAKGPMYHVKFRRRREERTDYRKRLKMLSSRKPRLVVRGTNKRMICQLVEFDKKGDKTLFSSTSSELEKYGWKAATSSIPSAYLTGLLIGKKGSAKVKDAILDIGLREPIKGARVFAAALGARDAGINVAIGDVIPPSERIEGRHIEEYAKSLKKDGMEKQFSACLKSKVEPAKLSELFQETKKNIVGENHGRVGA